MLFAELDLIPLTATLISALLLNLEYGILIGLATNMVFLLYTSARPKLDIEQTSSNIYTVKLSTGLQFAAAEYVRETILQKCNTERSTIVIDGKYVRHIDATVAKVRIKDRPRVLKEELNERGKSRGV